MAAPRLVGNRSNAASNKRKPSFLLNLKRLWNVYFTKQVLVELIFDPSKLWIAAVGLLLAEVLVNVLVIWKIPYTEIDWVAYMQEVQGVANGTFDYMQLKGNTGPLVYPAGFVYIYLILYYITNFGTNVRLAQYIFAGLYMLTLASIFRIYSRTKKIPPYALIFICCTSYRIHSIFVLRLFNDPIAMLLFYASVNLFLSHRWSIGCLVYSIAVSVKMNVLLFSPGLFVVLLATQGVVKTAMNLALCAAVQLVLGLPFLVANPVGYISRSFDLGRVFMYEWTVNWRFLPEEVFLNRYFHALLLFLHVMVLLMFVVSHWWNYIKLSRNYKGTLLFSDYAPLVLPMFVANFVGIAFSRSLHYQFYVWYFHSLPFLLWSTPIPPILKIGMLGVIEMAWNTYPSTIWSSAALHVCHLVLLVCLWRYIPQPHLIKPTKRLS